GGKCDPDGRCKQASIGAPCTNGLQCFGSRCGKDGALISAGSGLVGTCCNGSSGTGCNPARGNADCCFGVCRQVSDGRLLCGAGRFRCESGAGGTLGAGCTSTADGCSGKSGTTNAQVCDCSPGGGTCATDNDCCRGNCSNGVCFEPPPK